MSSASAHGAGARQAPSVALVTISYSRDRDRCALLCRSLERFAPTAEHWIVVDRADLAAFAPLARGRTTLVALEEVLPIWLLRLNVSKIGLRSSLWLQARGRPVRGWLVQQLAKLAVVRELTADVVVHTDSDVVLVRPFEASDLVDERGRVRLYSLPAAIDESLPNHVRWHRTAEKVLTLPRAPLPLPDFITSFVPWKRENAVALLARVEERTGRHWARALAGAWGVSEYILYGRFVTEVLGDAASQFTTPSSLCRDYWAHEPLAPDELEAFLDGVDAGEVAVSITAKAGMDPRDYADALERRWTARST
jgi:Family of unknown function (DUF6492)